MATEDEDLISRRRFSRRALLLGAGQLGIFGLLGGRLYGLQVADGQRLAPLADDNRIDTRVLLPERGRILDSAGRVLAGNENIFRVVVAPALAHDITRTLDAIARIVTIGALARHRIVRRARQARNEPIVVASGLTYEQVAKLDLLAPELPGVWTETAQRRQYAEGAAVGHIVGYLGAVERRAIDDDPMLRMSDMRVGKSGIERALDERLRGTAGSIKSEVNATGRVQRVLARVEPTKGEDVTLSVDAGLQRRVVERLARERRGAVVVVDVRSGELVVLASVPTFDPSDLVGGLTAESWHRLLSSNRPLFNRATGGLYPPGSTFKVVTALAALNAGVVSTGERIECPGRFELGGQTFRCWNRHGHGHLNLHGALAQSCDVYFYEIARRTGIEALAAMAHRLGLGKALPIEFANQKSGVVPTPDWKRGHIGTPWVTGETILAGIGQGYVQVTPLQLAVMTARVATGREVEPTIVKGGEPPRFAPLDIDPKWLDAVRRGMVGVVNEEGGTGSNARLETRGVRVAGKTGTSQVHRASTDRRIDDLTWEERDHALFVGFVPAERPTYAVAAVIEHGGGGGAAAAPLVRDVIEMVLAQDAGRNGRVEGLGSVAPGALRSRHTRPAG